MPRFEQLPKSDIEYLTKDLYDSGENLRVLPHSFFKDIDPNHIRQFCVENGVYCLPTTELIQFLKERIGEEKKVVEIGAGHGAIARELGIIATDNKLQNRPEIKVLYDKAMQAIVKYGRDVEYYDAEEAVRRYKPNIVIAAWVTHKYNPKQHAREGNQWGVREDKILKKINKYIFIGSESPHSMKPLLDLPHETFGFEWLVSRNQGKGLDRIWIWEGGKVD